jgi:hypothetical protein
LPFDRQISRFTVTAVMLAWDWRNDGDISIVEAVLLRPFRFRT